MGGIEPRAWVQVKGNGANGGEGELAMRSDVGRNGVCGEGLESVGCGQGAWQGVMGGKA